MREAWRKLTFADEEMELKEYRHPVNPAEKSDSARLKASTKKNSDDLSAQSFNSLLLSLSGIRLNTCQVSGDGQNPTSQNSTFTQIDLFTPLQQKAFDLLQSINRVQ